MKNLLLISLFCLLNINSEKDEMMYENKIISSYEINNQNQYDYFFTDLEKEYRIETLKKEKQVELNIKNTYSILDKKYKSSNGDLINYLVYRPYEEKEEKLPLIIYLHGMDGNGNDINKVRNIKGLIYYIDNGELYPNAVIIAPQIPVGASWTSYSKEVMELISIVIEDENIDKNKISLTGMSLGGIGTLDIAIKNPNFFSCIVPVCANINANRCAILQNVKVKIFHGTEDYSMGFSVIDANKIINENGGNSELFMLEGEGHEIRHIYIDKEYDIVNWMISQERVIMDDCNTPNK